MLKIPLAQQKEMATAKPSTLYLVKLTHSQKLALEVVLSDYMAQDDAIKKMTDSIHRKQIFTTDLLAQVKAARTTSDYSIEYEARNIVDNANPQDMQRFSLAQVYLRL